MISLLIDLTLEQWIADQTTGKQVYMDVDDQHLILQSCGTGIHVNLGETFVGHDYSINGAAFGRIGPNGVLIVSGLPFGIHVFKVVL